MPFNSLAYLLLLGLSCAAVHWLPRPAWALSLASLVFYAVAGPFDTAVFLVAVALNWLMQMLLPADGRRIAAAVVLNAGLIGYFKYRNLLLGDAGHSGSYLDTALPLGISFYSLQALAYHIDVVKRTSAPAQSLREFFLFKAFFPQLVAGPIVRAHQVLPQVQRLFDRCGRRLRFTGFALGLIVLGLAKKVLLADSLGPLADEAFAAPPDGAYRAWIGALLFTFQIYFDFSGYSDIAIGSAYLLGVRLPWNFRTPYMSTGPREFWQRWHISLSTWIRDYVYIPLGGGRGGAWRAAAVLVGTMALAGLWHGANYTFIVWGAAWGVYILAGRLAPAFRLPGVVAWLAHMGIVVCLWVLFRSPSLGYALEYLRAMFGLAGGVAAVPGDAAPAGLVGCGIAALFALQCLEARLQNRNALFALRRLDGPMLRGLFAGLALLLLLVLMPTYNVNPFIYFRF